MYGIAQVDNAFYRLMGVRAGGTAWERLPGNFGDDLEKASQARFHALSMGEWQEVVIGLDVDEPRPELN